MALTRRSLFVAVPLVVVLVVVALLFLARGRDLKSRSALISVGMSREQVEDILGPPALEIPRSAGRGTLWSWVDQFWQVDVLTGPDGRVESVGRVPSRSAYRQAEGYLKSLFK